MMRLTRKLYSEPDDEDEDEKDEKTWKRRRNIGIIGAGTGLALNRFGASLENGKSGISKRILEHAKKAAEGKEHNPVFAAGSKNARQIKIVGGVLGTGGAILGVGSELKRRKLKKKNDDNKA